MDNNENDLSKMYDFIKKKIETDNQVYFVAPLIEESNKNDIKICR